MKPHDGALSWAWALVWSHLSQHHPQLCLWVRGAECRGAQGSEMAAKLWWEIPALPELLSLTDLQLPKRIVLRTELTVPPLPIDFQDRH